MKSDLSSSEEKPLQGVKVLVTRPRSGAASFSEKLRALGAEPIEFPTIAFAPPADGTPLDRALEELEKGAYHWVIFTSATGVRFVWRRLPQTGHEAHVLFKGVNVAVIGPATARALEERGVHVDYVPEQYVAEAIAAGLGDLVGQRILLPRAEIARRALPEILRNRGATVDEVAAYRTLSAPAAPEERAHIRDLLLRGEIGVVTFTSSSTVRSFLEAWEGEDPMNWLTNTSTRIACIGPITARTARDGGLHVDIVAREHTVDGLIRALLEVSFHA